MKAPMGIPGCDGYYHVEDADLTPTECPHYQERGSGRTYDPPDILDWDSEDHVALGLIDDGWSPEASTEDILFDDDDLLLDDYLEDCDYAVTSTTYRPVEELPSDTTGMVIWGETTSSDPECQTASKNRKARAMRKAQEAGSTWTCPYCGESFPAVNIRGETRKGCPNSRCAGKAQAAASHAKGAHIQFKYGDDTVSLVADAYIPGIFGYRQIASITGIPSGSVRNLIKRASKRSKDHE